VDLLIPDGTHIPIEEREAEEVRCFYGTATTPEAAAVMNPAFDVTPHELITAIITERGVKRGPYGKGW
jgi:methylthioribose-1-phosphate isomerase